MKGFPADFDPNLVPRWPRLTLEITGSGQPTVYKGQLGGRAIPLDETVDTADPYAVIEASVRHASALIAERGWDTCRVSAVDPDGHIWPMILGAGGERYDLTASEDRSAADTAARAHPMRKLGLILAAAILVPALIVGGLLIGRHYAAPAPVAAGPYTPRIAELPVPAPAGWTTHAAWHVDDLDTDLAVEHDDAVWLITGGSLIAVAPHTGQQLGSWPVGASARGPWLTTIDGTSVVAAATNTTVMWVSSRSGQATSRTIPNGSTVTATVDGLWWTHENNAWIAAAQPQRRTIPADADINAAEGSTLIATDRLGRLWRLDSDAIQTPAPIQLPKPTGAASLDRILGVGTQTIAATWHSGNSTGDTIVSFHTTTGQPAAAVTSQVAVSGQPRTDPRRPDLIVAGRVIVDLKRRTLTPLPRGVSISGMTDGLGFGRQEQQAVTINLHSGTVRDHSPTVSQPATPVAVVDDQLLVIDSQTLYCLDTK